MSTSSISSASSSTSSGMRSLHGGAGDGADRVRDRLQVLDVAGADDVDAGVADRAPRPASASRGREPGALECASSSMSATVGRRAITASTSISSTITPRYSIRRRGTTSRPSEQLRGPRAAVGLDEADDDVRAALRASMPLLEHPVRLADAGSHAQVDPQPAAPARCVAAEAGEQPVGIRPLVEEVALGHRSTLPSHEQAVQVQVELQHVDPGLAEEEQRRLLGVPLDGRADHVLGETTGGGDPGHLVGGCLGADVRVETGGGAGHEVDRDGRVAVGRPQRGDPVGHVLDELGAGGPEVGARGRHRVVAGAGGGRPTPQVLRVLERLADEARAERSCRRR